MTVAKNVLSDCSNLDYDISEEEYNRIRMSPLKHLKSLRKPVIKAYLKDKSGRIAHNDEGFPYFENPHDCVDSMYDKSLPNGFSYSVCKVCGSEFIIN